MKLSLMCSLLLMVCMATAAADWRDSSLPAPVRARQLVAEMTLAEKISQMQDNAAAIPRLQIPAYHWWNEALHGVARAGIATVFPQAIGLGATWDAELIGRIASVIGDEARAKHHEFVRQGERGIYQGLTFWSPNINIFRDPRWGRGQETYGEDPFLTGRLGVAFVKGLQGDDPRYFKAIATPKHYAVHSGPEPDRHGFDALATPRDLHETYLAAFEMCVREAGAHSIMCAYNRYEGEPCCSSTLLMADILRREWGFDGYVVSDCGAISDIYAGHKVVGDVAAAAARAVKAGCDLSCGDEYSHLTEAVQRGLISEADITTAAERLFTARFRLGEFDPPGAVPYAQIPYSVNDSPEHDQLALEAARASLVLLKNENHALPWPKTLKKVAVIGPNADNVELLLGNYNGTPSHPVTPLEGIRRKLGSQTQVTYAPGCALAEGLLEVEAVPPSVLHQPGKQGQPGLMAEYFANPDLAGQPLVTRVDPAINFSWGQDAPAPGIPTDGFSVRWSGRIRPAKSGLYEIGMTSDDGFRLWLDGKLITQDWTRHGTLTKTVRVQLTAGRDYKLRVEYFDVAWDAIAQLVWQVPGENPAETALAAARDAEAVIFCMGISPRLEGEEMNVQVPGFSGGDRTNLELPRPQRELMQKVASLGKPCVLVLFNGSALSVLGADQHLPAILEAWYPGQRAGDAIADVLFGDYNPGGRLPVTFYRSVDQLPPFDQYSMAGRTYRYFSGEVLYPFGHGLSFTSFAYDGLTVPQSAAAGAAIPVEVTVRNTGALAGDEVVQLYLSHEQPASGRADAAITPKAPIRSLAGFRRLHLQPGESRRLSFNITPRQLSLIHDDGRRLVEPGWITLSLGGKQPGFSGTADAPTTQVIQARCELTGEPVSVK